MSFTEAVRNGMLDSAIIDDVSLHTADPGSTGANEVTGGATPYARQAATFAAAASGSRALSAAVDFTGPASGGVTHFGAWNGATFVGGGALSGDLAFNAEGAYRLTTGTALSVT